MSFGVSVLSENFSDEVRQTEVSLIFISQVDLTGQRSTKMFIVKLNKCFSHRKGMCKARENADTFFIYPRLTKAGIHIIAFLEDKNNLFQNEHQATFIFNIM